MNSAELTGAVWRKSSRSNGQANCVEVAFLDSGRVAMRDSKNQDTGPALIFTPGAWRTFACDIAGGALRRP